MHSPLGSGGCQAKVTLMADDSCIKPDPDLERMGKYWTTLCQLIIIR
ncbi:hypothetical protein [Planktothrix mougeotii]|uniref:Uncharacterized protein n=1 Tax=Planktothrix mougeotii LEGE 06226 TaxID=1828728 RepID=A0ABR9UDN6_9CYAN|nr:hypothetical protein [Planktothrix mougeotii]MBE9144553.1 hypothetical protein [Planktothrix mougeotii LEGE 06226]